MVNKKESNRAKRDRIAKEAKDSEVFKSDTFRQSLRNTKDPNSNNSLNAKARFMNAQTKVRKLALGKEALDVQRGRLNLAQEKFKYKKEQDTAKENDKLLKAQQRQAEYKQKRKEYIGKSISGALESWKFKF